MTEFKVDTSTKTTILDGVDVTDHVSAVDVYMEAGIPPEVQVWVNTPSVISGDGIVTVHEPVTEESLRDGIRAFLEGLDPREVQAQALALPQSWATVPAQLVIQALLGAL